MYYYGKIELLHDWTRKKMITITMLIWHSLFNIRTRIDTFSGMPQIGILHTTFIYWWWAKCCWKHQTAIFYIFLSYFIWVFFFYYFFFIPSKLKRILTTRFILMYTSYIKRWTAVASVHNIFYIFLFSFLSLLCVDSFVAGECVSVI